MELKKGDKKWEKEEMKWKTGEINYENAMAYNKKLANLILKVCIYVYNDIPYKQKYWRTIYLAVCPNNAVGGILNWQISVLYGEKPMLVI